MLTRDGKRDREDEGRIRLEDVEDSIDDLDREAGRGGEKKGEDMQDGQIQ